MGFTSFYEKVTLVIEKDSEQIPSTFLLSDLKKGNTAAILYAEKSKSLVVETCLDFVFVFKSNGKELFEGAAKLLVNQDILYSRFCIINLIRCLNMNV